MRKGARFETQIKGPASPFSLPVSMPPITRVLGLSQKGRGSREGEEARLQAGLPHWGEHEAAPSLTF